MALVDEYMQLEQLGLSGLTSASIAVSGINAGAASVVASFSFVYTPKTSPDQIILPISPQLAASYFSLALHLPQLLPVIANATLFPVLSQSVVVANIVNGTDNAAQQLTFTLQTANEQPNTGSGSTTVAGGGGSVSTQSFATPLYTAQVDYSLGGSPANSAVQITVQLQLQYSTYGNGYDKLQSLLVAYQPLPSPDADPDTVANTAYPVTTLNSSSPSAAVSLFNEQDGHYYLTLLSVPTQPGGLNYSLSLTDWQSGATSPFFTQQVFAVGPPTPPTLLYVCHTSELSAQLAYLPSEANGMTPAPGNVNLTYAVTITLPGGLIEPVPAAGLTSQQDRIGCTKRKLHVPCGDGYCAPPVAYLSVDFRSIPALLTSLASSSVALHWNFSMTAVQNTSLTVSAVSSYEKAVPIAVAPGPVTVQRVVQRGLAEFQLIFPLVSNGGARIRSWLVGYAWQSSPQQLHLDPAASSTYAVVHLSDSKTSNGSVELTIPSLLSGPVTTPFLVSVQAVTKFGTSPLQQHLTALPVFVGPPSQLQISLQPASGGSSPTGQLDPVLVQWTAPPASAYSPSPALAAGFLVMVNATSSSESSVTRVQTSNTFVLFSDWQLATSYALQVSALINSSDNPTKLCTAGAVAQVPSEPLTGSFDSTAPPATPAVSLQQSGANVVLSWPQNTTAADTAFTVWFAPASSTPGTARDSAAVTSSPQVLSSSSSGPVPLSMMTAAIPFRLDSAGVLGSVLPYVVGLQATDAEASGRVVWSDTEEAADWLLPAWGDGLLALPAAASLRVSQTAATAGSAAVELSFTVAGALSPQYSLTASYQQLDGSGAPISLPQPLPALSLPVSGAVISLPLNVSVSASGSQYRFTFQAQNEAGASPSASSVSQMLRAAPASPASLAVMQSAQQLYATFPASASDGGSAITAYTLTARSALSQTLRSLSVAPSSAVNGLLNFSFPAAGLPDYQPGYATSYQLSVYAVTAYGNSAASAASTSAAVTTASACCLSFAGAFAYPSFSLPASNAAAQLANQAQLQTYLGHALPWYGAAGGSATCQSPSGLAPLSYWDEGSAQFTSSLTGFGSGGYVQVPDTTALQWTSSGLLQFSSFPSTLWNQQANASAFLTGRTLMTPVACNLGRSSPVQSCLTFTVNSPSAQLPGLSWSASQAAACSQLLS